MRSFAWIGVPFAVGIAMFVMPLSGCGSKGKGFPDGGDSDGDPCVEIGNCEDADLITDAGDPSMRSLTVIPPNPVLNATGTPVTQQFTALFTADMTPDPNAQWSLDNVALGAIDSTGLFKAVGNIAGVATIEASDNGGVGSTTVTVNVVLTENPGNVSQATQNLLKNGGNADAQFRWLYPYNKTVFPRGLPPAVLQFDGVAGDAFMLHMKSKFLDYTGFFGAQNPSRVTLSAVMWKNILLSVGASDPLTVEVTKLSGGQVTGPAKETWTIAQGALRGTCYYNTYDTGGATIKLKIGTPAVQLVGGCNVCHSVSANGMVLSAHYGQGSYGATYDLSKPMVPIIKQGNSYDYSFPALYPDGSLLLTTYGSNIPGMSQNGPPHLIDVKTGNTLAAPGIDNTAYNPQMPAFSPDGKFIAFNRRESGSQTLSMMNFDKMTKTFSKITDLFTDPQYPGWPQFTPDSKVVLYHSGNGQDYATWSNHLADIMSLDVAGKKSTKCDALNGMTGNTPYLPYGAQEQSYNFEPTTLPLAVGGYYWTIITSRRFYGNTTTPSNYPSPSDPHRKKLWVAAIDINAVPGKDSSHPAFYLEGQDLNQGSLRGFWALDPCKANGQSCEGGDECCGGFCRQVTLSDGGIGKQCVPPPMGCHQEYEICTVAQDCCDTGALCIAGHCAKPPIN